MVWRRWLVGAVLIFGCGSEAAEEAESGDSGDDEAYVPPDIDDQTELPDGDEDPDDEDPNDEDRDDGPPMGTVSSADCGLEGTQILGEAFETDDPFRASSSFAIEQLEVDDAFVYFADRWGLHRVARDGGSSELIVEDAWPFNDGLVLHDGSLMWTRNTAVGWELQRAAVAGGTTSTATEFEGYTHWLRSDGRAAVWSGVIQGVGSESRIYAWASGDTTPTVLATGRYGWQADVDAGNVYATGYLPGAEPVDGGRVVFRLPTHGGAATVLADGFDELTPGEIAAMTSSVAYVVSEDGRPRGVQRIAKSGGEPVELPLGDAPVPDTLVADADRLVGFTVRGEVWSFPAEGTPVHLTTTDNQLYPGHVAIDGDSALVVHHTHECVQLEQVPDEHTGSLFDVCRRSITRRCIESIVLP